MGSARPNGGSPAVDPIFKFRGIVQDVVSTAEESCGVEDIEPGLERALAVLQRNSGLREKFEMEIISMLDSLEEGMAELISFVMHELRWRNIEEEVRSRVLHPRGDASKLRLYEAILDAFSDTWGDRDLYSKFFQ
jgi:hypothetical protein